VPENLENRSGLKRNLAPGLPYRQRNTITFGGMQCGHECGLSAASPRAPLIGSWVGGGLVEGGFSVQEGKNARSMLLARLPTT